MELYSGPIVVGVGLMSCDVGIEARRIFSLERDEALAWILCMQHSANVTFSFFSSKVSYLTYFTLIGDNARVESCVFHVLLTANTLVIIPSSNALFI